MKPWMIWDIEREREKREREAEVGRGLYLPAPPPPSRVPEPLKEPRHGGLQGMTARPMCDSSSHQQAACNVGSNPARGFSSTGAKTEKEATK